jgi:hypothetical protein
MMRYGQRVRPPWIRARNTRRRFGKVTLPVGLIVEPNAIRRNAIAMEAQ